MPNSTPLSLLSPRASVDDVQPWDSDHTSLVHVLWAAQRGGITISDTDVLASHIMRSKWMKAVRLHAKEGRDG